MKQSLSIVEAVMVGKGCSVEILKGSQESKHIECLFYKHSI